MNSPYLPYQVGEASLTFIAEQLAERSQNTVMEYGGDDAVALILGSDIPESIVNLFCAFKYTKGVPITVFKHDDPRLWVLTTVYQPRRRGAQVVRMLPPALTKDFSHFEHLTLAGNVLVLRWWKKKDISELWPWAVRTV